MTDLREPGSRAILIGASTYASDGLANVPAVVDTLSDLRRALIERCGMARESIKVLQDWASAHEVVEEVAREAQRTPGVLIVYYAGHGFPGQDGDLYLAVRGTDPAPLRREDTAISYEKIARQLGKSPVRAIVVILDCCFSGLALEPGGPAGRGSAVPAGRDGGLVLASAAREEHAIARDGEQHTAFTGQLLTLLQDGAPGLTLRAACRYLDTTLEATGLPRPHWMSVRAADDIVLIPAHLPGGPARRALDRDAPGDHEDPCSDPHPGSGPGPGPDPHFHPDLDPDFVPGSGVGPQPDPGHLLRKIGVLAGAVAVVAVAAVLVALLVSPDHGGSNKLPLPTKSAQPTSRQTSTAATIACASGSIELIGSSTFGPIAKAAAGIYTRKCHVSINVIYGDVAGKDIDSAYGATTVNAAVQSKPAQAGTMIAMYAGETSTLAPLLTPDPVGVLIFSVVAHNSLYPGSDISSGDLKQLFLQGGEPGKVAVGRQAGSGGRSALLGSFGGQEPWPQASSNSCPPPAGSAVCTEYSNAELLGFVNGKPDAIGYAEVDHESNGHPANYPDVSVISINGVAPTPANVHNGSYNFATVANLYMPPHPSALAKSFYRYLLQYISSNQSDGLITCSGVPKSLEANC